MNRKDNQDGGKIAVILSIYEKDSIGYLKEAIDSLLSQSYKNYIICIGVDGKINEETSKYLLEIEKDEKVKVIRFNENRGLAAVMNDLIAACKDEGIEYFARMDADDKSAVDRFYMQVAFLEQHPEVDVVGGAIEEIDADSKLRGKKVTYPLTHAECRKFFGYRNPMAHPAVMFRRTFFEKVSGYRSNYRKNQDTMIWMDGFLNGCIFANIPETVLYFRVDDDFIKGRRHGIAYAMPRLKNRMMVNREMHYGIGPFFYAIAMFCVRSSPVWLIKIAYKFR